MPTWFSRAGEPWRGPALKRGEEFQPCAARDAKYVFGSRVLGLMRHHLSDEGSSKPVVPLDTPSGPPNENQFCLLIVSLYSDVFFAQRTTEYPISHGPEFKLCAEFTGRQSGKPESGKPEFDKPAYDAAEQQLTKQQHYH
jgi:hypothetical protein